MHEYSIVESTVENMLLALKREKATHVVSARFRRGSAFSEEAFRQAFQITTKGTLLENAPIVIETNDVHFACPCGHTQVIQSEELSEYHVFVCPQCGSAKEIQEAHDFELVDLLAATEDE